MDIIYFIFFWILVVIVAFFLALTLPTPHGWKGKLTRFLTGSPKVKLIMQGLIVVCIIAGLFFVDCVRTENKYHEEKS